MTMNRSGLVFDAVYIDAEITDPEVRELLVIEFCVGRYGPSFNT